MGDLSEHFSRNELDCKCGCGQDTVDHKLIDVLELVRLHFGKPVIITSGNRCATYNKQVGAAPNSQHVTSKAADIIVSGITPGEVYDFLDREFPNRFGIGKYAQGWTHIDVRPEKARWSQ